MQDTLNNRELKAGSSLCGNRYRINGIIGKGGFGITYYATHSILGNKLAIKEFFINGYCVRNTEDRTVNIQGITQESYEKYRQKFIDEANVLAQLDHQNIVKIIDVFNENNTTYIVMPLIEGETIQQLVERKSKLSIEDSVNYIAQIAEAVDYIHKKDILHRDIKPDNIIINNNNNAILIDFGSAREFVNDKTQKHTSILTPGYAPLEQYSSTSRKGAYSDIYSIGATLYFMLTGVKPLDAGSRAIENMPSPKDIVPEIPDNWNKTILKAMELKPENRYQNIQDFLNDLLLGNNNTPPKIKPINNNNRNEDKNDIKKPDNVIINNNNLNNKQAAPKKKKSPAFAILSMVFFIVSIIMMIIGFEALSEISTSVIVSIISFIGFIFAAIGFKRRLKGLAITFFILNLILFVVFFILTIVFASKKIEQKNSIINYIENDMVYVPGGTLEMGYTWEDYRYEYKWDYWLDAYVPVEVPNIIYNFEEKKTRYVNPFYISKYEVTEDLWNAVMYDNHIYKSGYEYPKSGVTYDEAIEFINKLNDISGENYRLPDEWEWEYAARGGQSTNNYHYAGGNDINELMWCGNKFWDAKLSTWTYKGEGNSDNVVHLVGEKTANELGLYDMSGNVWEWCYNDYVAPDGNTYGTKPLRGGSYLQSERCCYVSFRLNVPPYNSEETYGFRLVK